MTNRPMLLAVLLSAAILGCTRSDAASTADRSHIPLTVRPVGDSVLELAYRSKDGESRLRVRPQIPAVSDSAPIVATSWTLYAVPGYELSALLGALAQAHGNPAMFKIGTPLDSMRLNVALLAVNAARTPDGSFLGSGKGSWTAAKLFFADGDAELLLNMSPSTGEAEFVTKDEEYGPVVLREISRLRFDPVRKTVGER
jgi:hypothetical protein